MYWNDKSKSFGSINGKKKIIHFKNEQIISVNLRTTILVTKNYFPRQLTLVMRTHENAHLKHETQIITREDTHSRDNSL